MPKELHMRHPSDAPDSFRERTLHSRQLLEDARYAAEKHGDDWAEHTFGRAGELYEAHPVVLLVTAAMHLREVAEEELRRIQAWEEEAGPRAILTKLEADGLLREGTGLEVLR